MYFVAALKRLKRLKRLMQQLLLRPFRRSHVKLNSRTLLRFLSVALTQGACSRGDRAATTRTASGAEASRDLSSYTVLDSTSAPIAPLLRVGLVSLGNTVATIPASVDYAAITPHVIYIVDEASSLLRGYDRAGNQKFTLPIRMPGKDQLNTPVQLGVNGDTLLVTDIDDARGVALVNAAGIVVHEVPLHVASSTVGASPLTTGGFAVARISQDAAILDHSATFVAVVNSKGDELAAGCSPDSLYRQSIEHNGLFAKFRFVGVAVYKNLIYCRQPVTPVVRVLSPDGRLVTAIRVAPPFYRRAAAPPRSANQRTIEQFRSTWWEHLQFYPVPHGFVSVYGTYDPKLGDTAYRLFNCDSVGTRQSCGVARIRGIPVAFIPPDTVVVSETLEQVGKPRQLGLYVIGAG